MILATLSGVLGCAFYFGQLTDTGVDESHELGMSVFSDGLLLGLVGALLLAISFAPGRRRS